MAYFRKQIGFFVVALLFLLHTSSLVEAQQKYQCKGHEITVSKDQVEALKKCAEKMEIKSMEEITPEKIPCLAKCVLEGSTLVDDKGKPHKENILKGIDASVDDKMKDAYKSAIEKCIDEHSHHISPNDQTCLSYNPLAMCVTKAVKEICQA